MAHYDATWLLAGPSLSYHGMGVVAVLQLQL